MEMYDRLQSAELCYGANHYSYYAKGQFGKHYNPDQPIFYFIDPDPPRFSLTEPLPFSGWGHPAYFWNEARIPDEYLMPPPLEGEISLEYSIYEPFHPKSRQIRA